MFVDSHCHLSFPELRARLPQILAEMQLAKVRGALCICTTMEEFATVQGLAAGQPQLWASVGVHPDTEGLTEPTEDDLVRGAGQPKVIAIGETGLDYYRLNGRSIADMEWQRERFRTHIRAARRTDLPLVIHTRSASDDTLRVLKEEGASGPALRGVFHCFTETLAVARAAVDLGFYVSMSGIVSFRNAADLREVAAFVPLDRLLIETDSPYLAPVPCRGKTNTPALVPHVAAAVAGARGMPIAELAEATTRNFEQLFRVQVPALAVA
jgi:TatD DNase family protein